MIIDVTTVNPMDWYNTKFLKSIPDHFIRVKFRPYQDRITVLNWLETNASGRYAIESIIDSEKPRTFVINEEYQIGFENPADVTMYTMFFQ